MNYYMFSIKFSLFFCTNGSEIACHAPVGGFFPKTGVERHILLPKESFFLKREWGSRFCARIKGKRQVERELARIQKILLRGTVAMNSFK